jgi:hypothetical protein
MSLVCSIIFAIGGVVILYNYKVAKETTRLSAASSKRSE